MSFHFIGGAHQDFVWRLKGPLLLGQSHPVQSCSTQMGGVAFNVAWALRQLGHKVHMHSTGPGGSLIFEQVELTRYDNGLHMPPSYHTLLNERGECILGMADMQSYERWPLEILSHLPKNQPLVIDTNVSEDFLQHLFQENHQLIHAVVTSPAKALRLKKHLRQLHSLFLNEDEARALLESSSQEPLALAQELAQLGVNELYLTLGERGLITFKEQQPLHIPTTSVVLHTSNGAGDTLAALILHYRSKGLSVDECAKRAQEAVQAFLKGSREAFKSWAQAHA